LEKKTIIILAIVLGIVIIVPALLASMGALAYFGILQPKTLLPERCELQMAGINCNDYFLNGGSNEIQLTIENDRDNDLTIQSIEANSDEFKCSKEFGKELKKGMKQDLIIPDCNFPKIAKDQKLKIDLNVKWYNSGTPEFIHTFTGNIMSSVK